MAKRRRGGRMGEGRFRAGEVRLPGAVRGAEQLREGMRPRGRRGRGGRR